MNCIVCTCKPVEESREVLQTCVLSLQMCQLRTSMHGVARVSNIIEVATTLL